MHILSFRDQTLILLSEHLRLTAFFRMTGTMEQHRTAAVTLLFFKETARHAMTETKMMQLRRQGGLVCCVINMLHTRIQTLVVEAAS